MILMSLLPCPFCGEYPEAEPWHGGGPDKTRIACKAEYPSQCGPAPAVCAETPREAMDLWNRRSEPEQSHD